VKQRLYCPHAYH